jgi:hypothetical protein
MHIDVSVLQNFIYKHIFISFLMLAKINSEDDDEVCFVLDQHAWLDFFG